MPGVNGSRSAFELPNHIAFTCCLFSTAVTDHDFSEISQMTSSIRPSDKIVVVGGSGFVGTNLCQLLFDRGIDFEIIDIRPSRRFARFHKYGDVRDIDTLRSAITGTALVNLAAVHRDDEPDKKQYHLVNVVGATNVVKVCEEKNIDHIIFTSSVAVCGFTIGIADEQSEISPFNEYGRTKHLAELEFNKWKDKDSGNRLLNIVRPTVIFGPGNRGNVYNLLKQINSGFFCLIGHGHNQKSMAYIDNVVAFLFYLLEARRPDVLCNYADKPDFSMVELVTHVRERLGKKRIPVTTIPYWLGYLLGLACDGLAIILRRRLAVSRVRVRKFTETTCFGSKCDIFNHFKAPTSLNQGIQTTIDLEFLTPSSDLETFYTE